MSMIDDYKKKVDEAHKAVYGVSEKVDILNEGSINKIIYSTKGYCVTVADENTRVSNKNQIHFKIYNNIKPKPADEMSRLNPFTGEIIMSHKSEGGKKNVSSLAKKFYKIQNNKLEDGRTVIQAIADAMNDLYNRKDISPNDFVDFKDDLYVGRSKK